MKMIHPAVCVTAGFFLIFILQLVSPGPLTWAVIAAVAIAVALAWPEWIRVIRRMRFIFLAIAILFLWQTPGRMILPALGNFSPTWDGLRAAVEPVERLCAVVSVVALLLHYLSTEDWVNSLYVLVHPLRYVGLSAERFAVRLRLVLDYIAQRDLNWKSCLDELNLGETTVEADAWVVRGLAWTDRILLGGLFLLLLGFLLW